MRPRHGRLSDPVPYQGLQHFITHATWEVRPFWRRLRELVPCATCVGGRRHRPAKQGTASVGVQRQFCGPLDQLSGRHLDGVAGRRNLPLRI
jgi:SRSO17 transposase